MTERGSSLWTVDNLLRPAMIAGMMACLTAPLVHAMQWIGLPRFEYFILFAFVASLEGILSERLLRRRSITGFGYLASRLAEAIVLLLLLKFSTYLSLGLDQLRADSRLWLSDPYQFFSPLDVALGMLFVVMWVASLHVARVVMEMDATELMSPPPEDKTSVQYYLWMTRPPVMRDRQKTLSGLIEVVLWGGIFMLVASAVIHFMLGSARVLALPMLLYFALGIALLAQGRFSAVHLAWEAQGIDVQPHVARRWLGWAVVFLVGVSLASLLLPTHYTLGPLQALLGVLTLLYTVLSFLVALLFFLIALPLWLLLPGMESPTVPSLNLGPAVPISDPSASAGPAPWLQTLGSAIFWGAVVAIIGYALYRFWRDRAGREEGEPATGTLWGRFVAWIRALWARWRAMGQQVQEGLARRRAARRAERPPGGGLSRLFFAGRLPPRELIRFYYLSAARRAADAGQPRRKGQTPYEYRESLDEEFPDLEPDLEGLTDAFVEARYSHQPVEQERAAAVKPLWQRVKAALRRRRL